MSKLETGMLRNFRPSFALRTAIEKSGMTAVSIAAKLGIRPETVSRHMNGKNHIDRLSAIKYAEILGLCPERILFPPKKIHGSIETTVTCTIKLVFPSELSESKDECIEKVKKDLLDNYGIELSSS